MFLKDYLINLNASKIDLFVDMDGVIADYAFKDGVRYDNKRPLYDSINKLKEINNISNITLHTLSVTRVDRGVEEKNIWLDKYAPFFKKENRHLLSRESNDMKYATELKCDFLSKEVAKNNSTIVFIDDDPAVYRAIKEKVPTVYMLKDSALVD